MGDITVDVKDGILTLKGEKKSLTEKSGETWYFSERQFGSFSRAFRLPQDAESAKVSAALKDGVLTVHIPKKTPENAPSTRVKIQAS